MLKPIWRLGRVIPFTIVSLILSGCLVACSSTQSQGVDVLTQKDGGAGKTQITVLVKHAFSINTFEAELEKQFPNVDLVQVGNYSRDMGIDEYAARLEHDDLTDVIMTWPLDVGEEYWDDRLIDLSGMEFTSRYTNAILNSISTNGKLYYLPGPAQIRGIVYNKTLFQENGWQIPTDYQGFLALCKTIEESGIRSIQLGFKNPEVLDTAFVGYNFSNYYSHPQDFQWLDDYNQGIGSFGTHFSGALDVFQEMVDAGVWQPSDLDLDYSDREKMLFSRQCAMVEDSALMARIAQNNSSSSDEFALMPFFNPDGESDWARLYMVCFIGLNKHLTEPENKAKYDLVLEIMEYISTPAGQQALIADTGAMFSSLIGMSASNIPEIEALAPALNQGRYAVFPTLLNAQPALRTGLAGMLKGTMTKADVIKLVDEQNANPPQTAAPRLLGKATEDFSFTDTGHYIADALRSWGQADVALYLDGGKDGQTNGKGVTARMYAGDITTADINRIMPDLKYGDKGTIWTGTITGSNLLKALEESIPSGTSAPKWFYYVSGLKLDFNPTACAGSRVSNVKTTTGKAIDPDGIYTIVVTQDSISRSYLKSCVETQHTAYDVVTDSIISACTISPAKDGRMTIK